MDWINEPQTDHTDVSLNACGTIFAILGSGCAAIGLLCDNLCIIYFD